ncbi:MAG: MipA/OmpV family protein [Rhodobacteraceae bacterium]|nr:MAG: MipA/OmpV family protein [Paracoccaceae bacterium]
MRLTRCLRLAAAVSCGVLALPAFAQERGLSFSITGGAGVAPDYFGSDSVSVGPAGSFGFGGLRFGALALGTLDTPEQFAPGFGPYGAFRFIGKRDGKDELEGMDDVKASVEIGAGLQYTEDFWQVFGELRYGAIGHNAVAGELGANVIFRGESGLVLNAGPRAEFGNRRFNRTYFGVSEAEATASQDAGGSLTAFSPSAGFYSVGVEAGAYQPLSADWGLSGSVRFDRLRGDAADSPIVQQGSRNQISAEIGLTRHFNLRF